VLLAAADGPPAFAEQSRSGRDRHRGRAGDPGWRETLGRACASST